MGMSQRGMQAAQMRDTARIARNTGRELERKDAEIAELREALDGAKDDALRLHSEKMDLYSALLEIKCGDDLTGAECMAIATRALDERGNRDG